MFGVPLVVASNAFPQSINETRTSASAQPATRSDTANASSHVKLADRRSPQQVAAPSLPVTPLRLAAAASSSLPVPAVADRIRRLAAKQIIGATARIHHQESGLEFRARVDTGARRCSIHFDELVVEDESREMADNVGKPIRFKLKNRQDEARWVESRVDDCVMVKSSDNTEWRYLVPLTLSWNGLTKRVMVTLNDRAHMQYRLLLGRNFLGSDFLVDITLDRDQSE